MDATTRRAGGPGQSVPVNVLMSLLIYAVLCVLFTRIVAKMTRCASFDKRINVTPMTMTVRGVKRPSTTNIVRPTCP